MYRSFNASRFPCCFTFSHTPSVFSQHTSTSFFLSFLSMSPVAISRISAAKERTICYWIIKLRSVPLHGYCHVSSVLWIPIIRPNDSKNFSKRLNVALTLHKSSIIAFLIHAESLLLGERSKIQPDRKWHLL